MQVCPNRLKLLPCKCMFAVHSVAAVQLMNKQADLK